MTMLHIAQISLAVTASMAPIAYTAWFKWWSTPVGRALFVQALGLALLIDMTFLRIVFGSEWLVARIILLFSLSAGTAGVLFEMARIKVRSGRINGVKERSDN